MGCCFNKTAVIGDQSADQCQQQPTQFNKSYTWQQRKILDPNEYLLEDLKDEIVLKAAGTVNGQQFLIRDCSQCIIYILDIVDSIIIEDCNNCKVIVGPTRGSIYVRCCRNSVMQLATGQLRLRDCRNLNLFVFSATSPIIESSTSIYFNCYQLYYSGLEDQFLKANLPKYNNQWSKIHDFTPASGETNYNIKTLDVGDFFPVPTEELMKLSLTFASEKSAVPVTSAYIMLSNIESYAILFIFHSSKKYSYAKKFYSLMQVKINENENINLLKTQELQFDKDDEKFIFQNAEHLERSRQGTIVGFLYSGNEILKKVNEVSSEVFMKKEDAYITDSYSLVELFAVKHPVYDTF